MRILGLDVGEKRIGVAISDPEGTTAHPLKVITRASDQQAVTQIAALCEEYEAKKIVYGVPLEEDGDFGAQAEETARFIDLVKSKVSVTVRGQDERFTTAQAERVLLEQDVPRKKRKDVIDMVAAAIILQSYLDKGNG